MTSVAGRRILVFLALVALSCARGAERDPFLVLAGPKDVVRIGVQDEAGDTVWALEAKPPRSVDAILYGVVPDGFTQLLPAEGSLPRVLVPGELLTAETLTSKRLFVHTGIAKSSTAMEILNYSMELLEPMR